MILKSQMNRGIFPTSEFPVVTKQQIRQMYFLGLILSKIISKSRIQSMLGEYQFNNQEMQKEITTVIEKDTTLDAEITQLKDSDCDCENEVQLSFPRPICTILEILWDFFFNFNSSIAFILDEIIYNIAIVLFCEWAWPPPSFYK